MSFTTFNTFSSNISKLEIPSLVSTVVKKTAYQQLLIDKKPWGRYSADAWSGTTLPELSGNTSRNATTSGVVRGTSAGNGATANITYLSGSATDTILWTSGSAPPTFTMCSLSRYVGTPTGSRVLTTTIGGSIQVIQGHLDNAGIVLYGSGGFVTSRTGVSPKDNWLNCCGTNSTTVSIPNNILINQVAVGTGSGNAPSASSTESMCINLFLGGNNQDCTAFSFSQFLIFDQVLTANELVIVSDALSNYLATGVLDTPSIKL